jgi:hypothetical protein
MSVSATGSGRSYQPTSSISTAAAARGCKVADDLGERRQFGADIVDEGVPCCCLA